MLVDSLKVQHPKLRLFDVCARFDSLATAVIRSVDTLPRARAIMEIDRLLASLEDGHTQIGLWWDDSIAFSRYPLRVFLFEDGVFVTRAQSEAQRLLGKRLVRIGAGPIDTIIKRLRPFLHGDNEMTRRDILETRLILHEVLERHTPAIFVGEPTVAPANHYGETRRIVLPHSGITVLFSSLYWQSGDPRDMRSSIEPSIRTPLRFVDYRNNADPSIEAILARPVPTE